MTPSANLAMALFDRKLNLVDELTGRGRKPAHQVYSSIQAKGQTGLEKGQGQMTDHEGASGRLAGSSRTAERSLAAIERRSGVERRLAERGLMHDLHDSVAAIRVLGAAALLNESLPAGTARQLQAICVEAERLTVLCDRRLGGDQSSGSCALDAVVGKVVRARRQVYSTTIEWQVAPAEISMSSTAVWRMLVNLLGNACRAAGPEGLVRISTESRAERRTLAMHVDDNGPGPGLGPRGSHGLGLQVVTSLLRAQGGSLTLTSGPLGGARATAVLPVAGECGPSLGHLIAS